jgi:glycosyltransferase involved in cell wall biosynthesis
MIRLLVSIIIPTYNRAHLIGETLDSVLAQTFTNWECIVVDDGSTDETAKLLATYCEKEERFQYYQRPKDRIKGANACRNYGFENSVGDYIIWFDSDDIMVSNHIALKVEEIINKDVDFVIAQTANFKEDQLQEPYKYSKPVYGIRAEDFILRKIHWYTYDIMLCRSLAEKISYHEKMKSWQDYNYFCKMLLISTKGHYIDVVLTHRRVHSNTIQGEMTSTKVNFNKELLEAKVFTYIDIHDKVSQQVKNDYLFGLINICFYLATDKKIPKYFLLVCKEIKNEMGFKSLFWFNTAMISGFIFNKGAVFLNLSKQK